VTRSLGTARNVSSVSASFQRLGGGSMVAGGALATAAWLFFAAVDPGRTGHAEAWWLPLNLSLALGGALIALGLAAAHARQAEATGALGAIGFVLFFVGLTLAYVGVQTLEALTRPNVPATIGVVAGIAAPSLFLGGVLTAIATWRAGIFPRGIAAALLVSMALGLLTRLVDMPPWLVHVIPAVFTATMLWFGISLVHEAAQGGGGHGAVGGRPAVDP
jgi:hypothetical protein